MRLIDADKLKEEVNKKNIVGRFNTLLLIDNAPTVDVIGEKIIRCPECKYYHKRWHSDRRMKKKGYWCCWCDCHDDWVGGTKGFCSLAERKEE